jgi:hypothetical protein
LVQTYGHAFCLPTDMEATSHWYFQHLPALHPDISSQLLVLCWSPPRLWVLNWLLHFHGCLFSLGSPCPHFHSHWDNPSPVRVIFWFFDTIAFFLPPTATLSFLQAPSELPPTFTHSYHCAHLPYCLP